MAVVEIIDEVGPKLDQGVMCIGIPAHQNERGIGSTICGVVKQERPRGVLLRIIVYVNGSKDQTYPEAKRTVDDLCGTDGITIKIVNDPIPGQARALNNIANEFDGEPFIEVQDDVHFEKFTTLFDLWTAGMNRPDRGAISIPSGIKSPIKRTFWWKVSSLISRATLGISSQQYLIDRACSIRPTIVQEFPDIVSVDCFMMLQCINNSKGYGVLSSKFGLALTGVPLEMQDTFAQLIMHDRGFAQMLSYPGYAGILPKVNAEVGKPNWRREVIESEASLTVKMAALRIIGIKNLGFKFLTRRLPYQSSRRKRVESTLT